MLVGRCDWYVSSHILVDPLKISVGSGLFLTTAFSLTTEAWTRVAAFGGVLFWIYDNTFVNYKGALRRNLAIRDRKVSSNMPTLMAHLRQLAAAGQIIQQHCADSRTQPAGSADASVSSSLALMHALKHHDNITHHLQMRLKAACLACIRQSRRNAQAKESLECQLDDDIANGRVDSIEDLMGTVPYHGTIL